MRAKVAVANRSPYGWWIASYIELAVWGKGAKTSPPQSLYRGKILSFSKRPTWRQPIRRLYD
jgi:hypothetical protein